MKKENENILGAFTLTISTFIVKVLGFFYKVPLSRLLGDEGMGYYNSALAVYAIFYILSASAIPKAFSLLLTRGRIRYSKKAYQFVIFLFISAIFTTGFFFSIVLHYFSRQIALITGVTNSFYSLKMIAPAICITSLGALCRGYMLSLNKMVSVAISEVLEAFCKLSFGLYFIIIAKQNGLSLFQISAYATLGISIGATLSFIFLFIQILICRKPEFQYGNMRFSMNFFILSTLQITVPLTMTSMLLSLSNILDLTMISKGLVSNGVASENVVAQYGNYTTLVLPLIAFISSLASSYCLSVFPKLTCAYENKNVNEFHYIITSTTPLLFICSLFIMFTFFFFGEDYFTLVFPNNNVTQGTVLIKIISPSVLFISLSNMINTILEATGNTMAPLITMGISVFIKIPLGYLAIQYFGIAGSAFSTVISYAVSFLISYFLLLKKTKIHLLKINDTIKNVSMCLVCFGIALMIRQYTQDYLNSTLWHILPMGLCSVLFLLFLKFMMKSSQKNIRKSTIYTNGFKGIW